MPELSRPTEADLADNGFMHAQALTWAKRLFANWHKGIRETHPEEARRLALAMRNGEASIVAHVDLAGGLIEFRLVTGDGDVGDLCASIPTPAPREPIQ